MYMIQQVSVKNPRQTTQAAYTDIFTFQEVFICFRLSLMLMQREKKKPLAVSTVQRKECRF